MASDQRFQRTVHAIAEAVQTFAAGTFDFAESIKQIWGPQAEPAIAETSAPLPIDGMQDDQMLDELRDRTPVSQDGDQLAIQSQALPASVTIHDGQPEASNLRSSLDRDEPVGSEEQPDRICYECFARWQRRWRYESAIPPCESLPGSKSCKYCTRIQTACIMTPLRKTGLMMRCKMDLDLAAQNGDAPIERQRFLNAFFEASDLLKMPLSPSGTERRQQKDRAKRTHQDIEEQQPVSKRQRTQDSGAPLGPERSKQLKKTMQQEQDGQGVVEEDMYSSSSASSEEVEEEEEEEMVSNEVQSRRREKWPTQQPDRSSVVINSEEGSEELSSSPREQHSEESSEKGEEEEEEEEAEEEEQEDEAEDELDGYSSEGDETVQEPALKSFSPEGRKEMSEETIQEEEEGSESYSSSSEYDSSEQVSEDEPENNLGFKTVEMTGARPAEKPSTKTMPQSEVKHKIQGTAQPDEYDSGSSLSSVEGDTESDVSGSEEQYSEEEFSQEEIEAEQRPATNNLPQKKYRGTPAKGMVMETIETDDESSPYSVSSY